MKHCGLNSLIQVLGACGGFVNPLFSRSWQHSGLCELQRLMARLLLGEGAVQSTAELRKVLGLDPWPWGRDGAITSALGAQLYARYIVGALTEGGAGVSTTSDVRRVVRCTQCGATKEGVDEDRSEP